MAPFEDLPGVPVAASNREGRGIYPTLVAGVSKAAKALRGAWHTDSCTKWRAQQGGAVFAVAVGGGDTPRPWADTEMQFYG